MKKRIDNWLAKHLMGVCLACLAFLLLSDAYYIMRCIDGLFGGVDYVFCAIDAAGTILYLIAISLIIRRKRFEKAAEMILEQTDEYYFHGFKLRRYVSTFAFWRFQKWLGTGRCYGMSVLAMILLKSNKTAILYRGDSYDKDGNFRTRHSWVEFKMPWNGWWVVDFAWVREGFCSKRKLIKAVSADGGKLEAKWSCKYDEFWNTPFVGAICEAMQNQEVSNIYQMLDAFGSPADEEYGFTEYCYSEEILQHVARRYMIPYYDCDGKPISSRVIRDFVKNSKRKQPKAKSIRLTRFAIRGYEKWKAEQEQSAASA